MDYVPAPIIAIVDAPNAAETAEKVTMRTEDTTNTLIPNQIRDSVSPELVTHMNARIGKNARIVNIPRNVFRIRSEYGHSIGIRISVHEELYNRRGRPSPLV